MVGEKRALEIFYSYAHEDQMFREELEKQLKIFQRQGLISTWNDQDIHAGQNREQERNIHLERSDIILLLISPDFIASDYRYSIEMTEALQRHALGEVRVIPILIRPVYWQLGPLGMLQALPRNGEPVTSHFWHSHDDAFFEIATGIREVLGEINASSTSHSLEQQPEESRKDFQHDSALEQEALPAEQAFPNEVFQVQASRPLPIAELGKRQFVRNRYTFRKRDILYILSICCFIGVLAVTLLRFSLFSAQKTVLQQPMQNPTQVTDTHLSVTFLRVDSPSYIAPGDGSLPTDIGVVSVARSTTSYYTIVLGLRNIQTTSLRIDAVTLTLLQIPSIHYPLSVCTRDVATIDTTHPYPVTYEGQSVGQILYAVPLRDVTLGPEEPDQLDIQVYSKLSVSLRFQVSVTYKITDTPQTLSLQRPFQVVFSDPSNWQKCPR